MMKSSVDTVLFAVLLLLLLSMGPSTALRGEKDEGRILRKGGSKSSKSDDGTPVLVTGLQDLVDFEEYVLLSVVTDPARVTEKSLEGLETAFSKAYRQTVGCCIEGGAFHILTDVQFLPDTADSRTNLVPTPIVEVGLPNLQNFTYLLVTRGQRTARGGSSGGDDDDDVVLFANTTLMEANDDKRRHLVEGPTGGQSPLKDRGGTSNRGLRSSKSGKSSSKGNQIGDGIVKEGELSCNCEGPTKHDFLEAFNDLVQDLGPSSFPTRRRAKKQDAKIITPSFVATDITQVSLEDDCEPTEFTTFETTVILDVDQSFLETSNGNDVAVRLLEQDFLRAYNQANTFNDDICDPIFRSIVQVEAGDIPFSPNRHLLLSENSENMLRQELQQDNGVAFAADAPSAAPTVYKYVRPSTGFFSISLFITVRCNRCPSDQNLFDDVNQRRRMVNGNTYNTNNNDAEMLARRFLEDVTQAPPLSAECLCPANVPRQGPTQQEVIEILQEQQNQGTAVQSIREVDSIPCGEESFFTTTVVVELTIEGGGEIPIPNGAREALGILMEDSYNRLSQDACDPFVRTIASVSLTSDLLSSSSEREGRTVNVPAVFEVVVRCRDCNSVNTLFKDEFENEFFGRNLQEQDEEETTEEVDDQCSCPTDAEPRGPTREEFDRAFEQAVQSAAIPNISSQVKRLTPSPTESVSQVPTTSWSVSIAPTFSTTDDKMVPTTAPSRFPSDFPSEIPSETPSSTLPTTESPSSSSPVNPRFDLEGCCDIVVECCEGDECDVECCGDSPCCDSCTFGCCIELFDEEECCAVNVEDQFPS